MAVALDQFVKLLEDSGILAGDTLQDFLPPKREPKSAEELALELVRQKKLTKFQAEEVSKGKGKSLTLGNYVLMEKIGAGGMGQVFKARHRRMDRLVAVKLLPGAMTKNKEAIARFEREVKAAAKLRHTNIVAADDADQANGVHFLVMELVEGSDLSALVKKKGPVSIEKAVNYIVQAAKGLEFAHKKGVIHRDIKPANLLLDTEGTIKILDMGLARIHGEAGTQAELTATGAVMGTVDYMAPEQALSTKTADARADIYSLGCSLYYLLTGKATYDGETLMAKLLAHRDQPIPDLRAACPEVPDELDAIFKKMVAKRLEDRYQSMHEVIVALESRDPVLERTIDSRQFANSSTDTGSLSFLKEISLAPPTPVRPKKKVAWPFAIHGQEKKKLLLIGGGLLGLVILLAGVILSFRTRDGKLIVTVNEPDAEIQVLNEENKVEITRKGEKSPITISVDPGKHRLKVQKDGFELFATEFEITKGGEKSITAKLVPMEDKPAVVGTGKPDEFVSLFNGRDLEGWKKRSDDDGNWRVENGVLKGSAGNEASWLFSKVDDWPDFHLRAQTRVNSAGSAGIICRTTFERRNEDPPHPLGYLAKINVDSSFDPRKTGSLYVLEKDSFSKGVEVKTSAIGPDEWFTLDIFVKDNHIEIQVNGKTTTDFVDERRLFANGQVALQVMKGAEVVEFRKIEIRKLEPGVLSTPSASAVPPLAKAPFDAAQAKAHQEAWARYLGTTVQSKNSVGMSLVLIPPGEYLMSGQKPVALTTPFRMGATEVTIAQFKKFAAAKGYKTDAETAGEQTTYLKPGYPVTDECPAAFVSREDAKAYCVWLSEVEKATYRLPTAAEWEFACRAGTTSKYSFGDDVSELGNYAWWSSNSGNCSHPVGTKLPNPFGLYDMHGNVEEFSSDGARPGFHGGGFNVNRPDKFESSSIEGFGSTPRLFSLGFRCVQLLDAIADSRLAMATATAQPDKPWNTPAFQAWVKEVQAMPAEKQVEAVSQKLMELNPGFDGKVTPKIEKGVVTEMQFLTDKVTDISPVRALSGVMTLACQGSKFNGILADVSPLRGMPLTTLSLAGNPKLSEISPLKSMPLTSLDIYACHPVTDIEPLKGMQLTFLSLGGTQTKDLTPLKGMPLKNLNLLDCPLRDLSPLMGMPLEDLYFFSRSSTKVTDLSPLKQVPLKKLVIDFKPERDTEILRSIRTLETLNGKPVAEFWKEVEEQQKGKKP